MKRMKAEWNEPGAGERPERFAGAGPAQPDVAGFVINVDLRFRRRHVSPARISPLWRNKISQLREGIENPHSGVCGEVRGEKSEMKIGLPASGAGKGRVQRGFIRTVPITSMMKQRDGRMQLSQDPFVAAAFQRLD